MKNFISSLFSPIREKKGYFILLVILTVVAIAVGVFAGVNFNSDTINIGAIAYIKFLSDDTSLVAMMFSCLFSLAIFFFIICICCCKKWLSILGIIFYLYFVYSQTVVFISLIMIYGFFNCLLLALFLLVYILIIFLLFMLCMTELMGLSGQSCYFSCCFRLSASKVLIYGIIMALVTILFCFLLVILKNFMILLVY